VNAGVKVIGEIQEPGFLEGGDFFPLGQDLAMVGLCVRAMLCLCFDKRTHLWHCIQMILHYLNDASNTTRCVRRGIERNR